MNNFLAELARRNVFRVAAAYVIVGWIVLQVVAVLMPALYLPNWMPSVAFTLLLIGFPIAVLLTWGFEMTPQGVRKIETGTGSLEPSSNVLDLGLLGIAAVLVIITALRPVGGPVEPAVTAKEDNTVSLEVAQLAQAPETSIAVLAFTNMSGNSENEYFSDGISEEILNALAGIKSMRVAARTSAFSFKGKDADIRVIGEALDVANVLEGSVRRSGDSVRVTAQLINVASGYHLWSKTYDRELTDIFAIQEEIARSITEALRVELNIEEQSGISRQGTDSIEAYSAYLKGLELRAATDFYLTLGARAYFKKAIELDPEYSDAWGALAISYAPAAGFLSFDETESELVEAFSAALRLDPSQPAGLVMKAFHTTMTTYGWAEAGKLYHRAQEVGLSGTSRAVYIDNYLRPLGRLSEATKLFQSTMRRDPLNHDLRRRMIINNSHEEGNNRFALEQLRLMTAAGENIPMFACLKAINLALLDREDEALESLSEATTMGDQWTLFFCAKANFHLGRQDQFDTLFSETKDRATKQKGYDFPAALLHILTGNLGPYIEITEKLLASRDSGPELFRAGAAGFKDPSSDPRYQKLLKAVRLDDASLAEMGMTWGEPE